jgi:hypothetical protein
MGDQMGFEQRDIRASAGGLRLASQISAPGRAAAFGAALMARYGLRPLYQPAPGFVLRRDRPLLNIHTAQQHTRVRLAPRIEFTLVQRLLDRGERLEAVQGPGRMAPAVPPGPPTTARFNEVAPPRRVPRPILPVPRVMRRTIVVAKTDGQQPAAVGPAPAQPHRGPVVGGPGPVEALAVDVNHLTNQVIQAIDRRIVAQRERLGRI